MGAVPTLLRSAIDTWVNSSNPARNYNSGATADRFLVTTDAAPKGACQSLIFFGIPFPRGVQIISAKLKIYQFNTTTASRTVTCGRATASWSASNVTWATRPGATQLVTATRGASSPGSLWEFDVTALMQTVSSGAPWYGFHLYSASASPGMSFHSSSSAKVAYRPVLEIAWKDNPVPPSMLHPSDDRAVSSTKPVLQCDFTDLSGDVSMAAINVRLFTTQANADANTSQEWDSGEVATTVPELDLSTTAYPGIAAGGRRWWRVRVKDGAGLWSGWSEPESFYVQTKGVIAVSSPGASVSESTPPIAWTFTGRTQKAFEVIIQPFGNSSLAWLPRPWSSGKITSAVSNYTLPDGVLTREGSTYRIYLRVWDTIDREASPGDAPYVEYTATFTYTLDPTVTPVSALTLTKDTVFPWVTLDFTRAAQPDRWDIYRDGEVIFSCLGEDLFVSGTSYRYVDRLADPRIQHTWKAVPVVNSKGSSANPTQSATVVPRTACLSAKDGGNPVLIWNPSYDMDLSEVSAVWQPAGDGPPILLTQSEHGYQGHVSGVLVDTPISPLTSKDWETRFNALKRDNGSTLLLTIIDRSFECFIMNCNVIPEVDGEGVKYRVDFDFFQTDWTED